MVHLNGDPQLGVTEVTSSGAWKVEEQLNGQPR